MPGAADLWVFKIGGSLCGQPQLRDWLAALAAHGGRAIIVPGGGPFANAVRAAQRAHGFSDLHAHRLALHAMEQFGSVLTAVEPRLVQATSEAGLQEALERSQVAVWSPAVMAVADPAIEPCWSVTSDSLAAWLGDRLGAQHLALVKMIAPSPGTHRASDLAERGIVDGQFPHYIAHARFRTWWLGRDDAPKVPALLAGSHAAAEVVR